MNIICTNDDGFESEGIRSLVSALRVLGHRVVMVAPDGNRSGYSHSMSLIRGFIDVRKIGADEWICSGTPVDCVIAMVSGGTHIGIDFKPDILVSGINEGCNLGTDILFSGTAAAAREAVLYDIPAIAFSLSGDAPWNQAGAAAWAASHTAELLKKTGKNMFFNVNMPNLKQIRDEYRITFPSIRGYSNDVTTEDVEGGWKRLNFGDLVVQTREENGSDAETVDSGLVSVSPIHVGPVVQSTKCPKAPKNRCVEE